MMMTAISKGYRKWAEKAQLLSSNVPQETSDRSSWVVKGKGFISECTGQPLTPWLVNCDLGLHYSSTIQKSSDLWSDSSRDEGK